MKKLKSILFAAVLSLSALQAGAQRLPVPIVNHDSVAIESPAGRKLNAEEVKQAIIRASNATGRKWAISEPVPGQLVATYHVRTHTVVTDIKYSGSHFSVAYKDSVNMKYTPAAGSGNIHPFYNNWVADFVQAIRLELTKA